MPRTKMRRATVSAPPLSPSSSSMKRRRASPTFLSLSPAAKNAWAAPLNRPPAHMLWPIAGSPLSLRNSIAESTTRARRPGCPLKATKHPSWHYKKRYRTQLYGDDAPTTKHLLATFLADPSSSSEVFALYPRRPSGKPVVTDKAMVTDVSLSPPLNPSLLLRTQGSAFPACRFSSNFARITHSRSSRAFSDVRKRQKHK